MSQQIENLYKAQKKDFPRAGAILADAFQHDPIWERFFEEDDIDMKAAFFQNPVRYCSKYGEVYATSECLEGIVAWVPGDLADMTIWRLIRIGSVTSGIRMGMGFAKLLLKMMPVFKPLEVDRKANMKGRAHLYLMIVGVVSQSQGQGIGRKLLGKLIEESEKARLPIYLETATERNVRMYERLGFKLINQITLPVIHLPQWEMIREPKA